MPFPFTALPTTGSFIERAREQGCTLGSVTVNGPDGPVTSRYLVGAGPKGAIAILPKSDDECLTPTMVEHLVRTLKVVGYDHCYHDDNKYFTYHDAETGIEERD